MSRPSTTSITLLVYDYHRGEAAARELGHRDRTRPGIARSAPHASTVSGAFLKTMLRQRAVRSWRDSIIRGSSGRRPYRIPREGEVPKITEALRGAKKSLASLFFQLASGHAMIAPFLKKKFGWVDSDQCWWCSCGRQSREHLFKECRAWKKEIRELWKKVGEISEGSGEGKEKDVERRYKKRRKKGFGFISQEYRVGPGNCSVGRLMSDPRFTEAVLNFLNSTQVGRIKKGVIVKGVEAV